MLLIVRKIDAIRIECRTCSKWAKERERETEGVRFREMNCILNKNAFFYVFDLAWVSSHVCVFLLAARGNSWRTHTLVEKATRIFILFGWLLFKVVWSNVFVSSLMCVLVSTLHVSIHMGALDCHSTLWWLQVQNSRSNEYVVTYNLHLENSGKSKKRKNQK